jgi:Ca-activated chloride channel family protein
VSFDNPKALLTLFLILPLVFGAVIHHRKHRSVLNFLSSTAPAVSVRNLQFRYWLSLLSFCLFLVGIILALAEPRGGTRLISETRRGVDVVFALDLSRSMDVRDVNPGGVSRLNRASAVARELVLHPWFTSRTFGGSPGTPGIRFGAAIGKGQGILALPLTEDTEAILAFLSSLSGSAVTGAGTNLESLIDAASGAFQSAFPSRRRIILLSDGESLEGSLNAALDRARDREITLIAVGFGTETGGTVPLGQDVLQDEGGHPVISALQSESLRSAAERTGGIYIDGNRGNAAGALTEYLASLTVSGSLNRNTGAVVKGFRQETKPRGYLFVLAALVFLGISKRLEKKRKNHG